MRKLICESDIVKLASQGQHHLLIDKDTMITAAAEDKARDAGIELKWECGKSLSCGRTDAGLGGTEFNTSNFDADIDPELIYRAVSVMADKGLLDGVIDSSQCEYSSCNCGKN